MDYSTVKVSIVTIFVRHTPGCKYAGEEFHKACDCRKHFRWSLNGKQYRKQAGTRSWAEAERGKRSIEDQLAGRAAPTQELTIREALVSFLDGKKTQGLEPTTIKKYKWELMRFVTFCEMQGAFMFGAVTLPLILKYRGTWAETYPSSYTRAYVQKRLRVFLRFCFNSGWLARVPKMDPIKITEPPTMPLTEDEYARLLAAEPDPKLRAIIKLMRWTGLAVRDASTIRRDAIIHDQKKGFHRVVVSRQKTGISVSIPIPAELAVELLAVANGNPDFVFWNNSGGDAEQASHWRSIAIGKAFKRAKIHSKGNMKSHRLRDTFAVDLLEKGVPLEEVSKLLGHESIKTTEQHYAKWVKGRQDRLDNLVTGTWKK